MLKAFHDQSVHHGLEQNELLARSKCYWPKMMEDIQNWIRQCDRCVLAKKCQVRPPLGNLLASRPLEVVAMDFTVLEKARDGRENVLVLIDVSFKIHNSSPHP